jgi:hypothetical protein
MAVCFGVPTPIPRGQSADLQDGFRFPRVLRLKHIEFSIGEAREHGLEVRMKQPADFAKGQPSLHCEVEVDI